MSFLLKIAPLRRRWLSLRKPIVVNVNTRQGIYMNKLAKFVRTPMFEGKYDANEDDAVEAYHLLNKYVFDNVIPSFAPASIKYPFLLVHSLTFSKNDCNVWFVSKK